MDKRYFAFISYKREDLKQAEWLRNKLSHYRFPSQLRKENNSLPKAIRPLFRDSLELAGGFLAKEIETALSESKYLIVICSPRSAKSPWVNKEVEYFIEHGHEEYIIPYIIDGEPFSNNPSKECFPPALRALKGEKELLGISTSELDKEAAAVKVVARMFGLRFDALWQGYNREQRRKRLLWSAAAIFLILVSVAVSGWFCYANSKMEAMNKEIKEQNNEILNKNSEILRKNEEINRGRNTLLISQSKYLASEAKKEYDKGNITKALRMALYALPKDLENPDRPYIPETEVILREFDYALSSKYQCRTVLNLKDALFSAVCSKNNKYLLTSSLGNPVSLWEIESGKKIRSFKNSNSMYEARFTPDGKQVISTKQDSSVYVWNIDDEHLRYELKHDNEVGDICISPCSKYIAVVLKDQSIVLWNIKKGNKEIVIDPNGFINSVFFSEDSEYIVTASDNGDVSVLDVTTGKQMFVLSNCGKNCSAVYDSVSNIIAIRSLDIKVIMLNLNTMRIVSQKCYSSKIDKMQFTMDCNSLFITTEDSCAYLLNVNSIEGDSKFKFEEKVINVALNSDGSLLATLSEENIIRIWDTKTMRVIEKLILHKSNFKLLFFSNSSEYLIVLNDEYDSIYLYDIKNSNGDFVELHLNNDGFNSGAFSVFCETSQDGEYLFLGYRNKVHIYNLTSNNDVRYLLHKSQINTICYSNKGEYLATTSYNDCNVFVRNVKENYKKTRIIHDDYVNSVAFSPDDKYIITASNDSTARIWDLMTNKIVIPPLRHHGSVESAVFSPDGKYVATSSSDSTACIWDASTGKPVTIPLKHNERVVSVVFCPKISENKYYVLTASYDDTACLWDAISGKRLFIFNHDDAVESAKFSQNGKFVVTASRDGTACVWNIETGKPVVKPLKHNSDVMTAVLSPNNKLIATACWNQIYLWNADNGDMLACYEADGPIYSIKFSQDGRYLATVNTVYLVNSIKYEKYALSYMQNWGWCVDISPDGRNVAFSCNDDFARVWPFPTLQELIDKYRKDPEHDWSLSQEEKDEYGLE